MAALPQTMISIAAAGGGLDISGAVLPQTAIQIASAAALSGKKPTIIFRSTMLPQTMIDVAKAGQGCVIFAV